MSIYDSLCEICVDNVVAPLYDVDKAICCDGNIQPMTSNVTCCCGVDMFDATTMICCDGAVRARTSEDPENCCSK